ncbi:hypothetical protein [Actinomadura madurae]|uniref:hypothetical protein n=1 Tax=Actinomadura madurae TaxID=1993 RepID=UPI0020D21AD4|nr:hypothetical protein [Actinomadura madurae]MCQ0004164.1 hypothetical protein [Actinomadura madurae]
MRYEEIREQIRAGTAARTLPAWAEGVLGEILDGAAAEGSPAPAVRHPLGFLCLPVERSGDLGVCLHIWTPEVRPSPVHHVAGALPQLGPCQFRPLRDGT